MDTVLPGWAAAVGGARPHIFLLIQAEAVSSGPAPGATAGTLCSPGPRHHTAGRMPCSSSSTAGSSHSAPCSSLRSTPADLRPCSPHRDPEPPERCSATTGEPWSALAVSHPRCLLRAECTLSRDESQRTPTPSASLQG